MVGDKRYPFLCEGGFAMASMTERMQKACHKYDSRQSHKPSTMRQAAEWAVQDGLLELPDVDPYDILADRMANAVRTETRTDPLGRRYRVNHAVRVTRSGVQYTFWGMMGFTSHDHMEKSFAGRRNQVIDDCFRLKMDVDVYNDTLEDKHKQFQLVIDFTDDIAEREEFERMKNRRKDVA